MGKEELLNIYEILTEKQQKLEKLQREIEELTAKIKMDNQNEEMMDISTVWSVNIMDTTYFCYHIEKDYKNGYNEFRDIFKYDLIASYSKTNPLSGVTAQPILETYPELGIYPNKKAPKSLIQKLYNQSNGNDAKTL